MSTAINLNWLLSEVVRQIMAIADALDRCYYQFLFERLFGRFASTSLVSNTKRLAVFLRLCSYVPQEIRTRSRIDD